MRPEVYLETPRSCGAFLVFPFLVSRYPGPNGERAFTIEALRHGELRAGRSLFPGPYDEK